MPRHRPTGRRYDRAVRLTIVGGGGFRTPHVWEALLRDHADPRVTQVVLHDTDRGRLDVMETVLRQQAEGFAGAPALHSTTDLRSALSGADFVFAAIRVGGLEGRCLDEHVALAHGVLGQETTGAGGIAYAIRTVPAMLGLARLIAEVAPTAYLLNFTNPAGIITEATQSVLGERSVGICDTPSGLGREVVAAVGADPSRVALDYVGLNHLGWLRRVLVDGVDVLPGLLSDDERLGRLEDAELFGTDFLRRLRSLPNEYLWYYYRGRESLAAIRAAGRTRGDYLRDSQTAFYADAAAQPARAGTLWREVLGARNASYLAEARGAGSGDAARATAEAEPGAEGYAGVALAVMAAISRSEPSVHILNVRNGGSVTALPDDAVVEIPARVTAEGIRALPLTTQPDLHQLGLMAQVKAVERHAIAAAVTGDPGEALQAFALHPLVGSVDVAGRLLGAYAAAQPTFAAALGLRPA